ncbi:vacuolar protein sorting-associated protein 41 homolog [Lepeophtheirus salmonis]|uniref:Light proteinlike [Tribolium castaneum] n=1 Tax=Lepeophtheirus salmonis TaxID=72036 RepID=A0A0K2TBD9_LEPSM|nr:vacuolar protein sorting-associated protein 41 homolog [Lepeophtheirus salmonis]
MEGEEETSSFSSSSSSSSNGNEDTEEPKLKYQRFCTEIIDEIRSLGDEITSSAIHSKFVILGTALGSQVLLDSEGNKLCSRTKNSSETSTKVKSLSIDSAGEFLISLSEDGVCLSSVMEFMDSSKIDLPKLQQQQAYEVAMDPIFNRSGRRFIVAGYSNVSLYEKTLFTSYRQTVISGGHSEGPFYTLRWGGLFVGWCSRKGIRIYDVISKETISIIKPPEDYRRNEIISRIIWITQTYLLVCQGSAVRVCTIKATSNDNGHSGLKPGSNSTIILPAHYVELSHTFIFNEYWVLGAAPLEETLFVVLALNKDVTQDRRPILMIVEPVSMSKYNIISSDVLSFKDCDNFKAKDYHLEFFPEDNNYLILSPNDVIVARLRDQDDHIDFLIETENYYEALNHAEENEKYLKRYTPDKIGMDYFTYLFSKCKYEEAAALCPRIFGQNCTLWEETIEKFALYNKISYVAPFLPSDITSSSIKLKPQIYEYVLIEFLNNDKQGFLELVMKWSPELYNVAAIVCSVVNKILVSPDDGVLHHSLATLFTYQKKYDKALAVYLKYGHPEVFTLIQSHGLVNMVVDKIDNLLELDYKKALALFLDNIDLLPPELIVKKIGYNLYLLEYLDAIKDNPLSWNFHGDLVVLYADFDPGKLLNFLQNSDHYPIQKALEVCEVRALTSERIYILARMGNMQLALRLIIIELADIHEAVSFCKKYDDPELWNYLIQLSLDKPYFINVLLHNIGTHVDPRILIMKIVNGQQIPGLRDSLVQIMWDYRLQVSLQEGCKRILNSDCYSLFSRSHKIRNRGMSLRSDVACGVCGLQLVENSGARTASSKDIVMFMCHHTFHLDCMSNKINCLLCHSSKTTNIYFNNN